MGRPVNHDPKMTRSAIVSCASDLFSSRGVADVGIREIARDSGVSVATVHHHFGNKEGLYGACVDRMYEEIASIGLNASSGPAHPDAVDEAIRQVFRAAVTHKGALRLLIRTVLDRGEIGPSQRERWQIPLLERTATALSGALGRTVDELRLPIQSLTHLVVRYAISSPEEWKRVTGAKTVSKAREGIETHLVEAARMMLSSSAPTANGGVDPC